ncbi:MAG: hypothetical protein HY899_06450, partial [Deltaproteobacteria bacterium]|nr:hypothetical protein [Deltaproteobacteria bacterium]
MEHTTRVRRALLASCLALAAVASPRAAIAQSVAQAKCRATMAQATNKYLKTLLGNMTRCHAERDGGAIAAAVDCSDPVASDPKGKLVAARQKASAAVAKTCEDTAGNPLAGILAAYPRCPSPAQTADDGGATAGIDSIDELAACLLDVETGSATHLIRGVMGSPEALPIAGAGLKCRAAVGKGLARVVVAIGKERAKCQKAADSAGGALDYDCANSDPNGKIAAGLAALRASIVRACTVDDDAGLSMKAELDALDLCGDLPSQLTDCVVDRAAAGFGAGLVAIAYRLPSTCRAGSARRIGHAAYGEQLTDSSLSAGSNGLAHGIDLADGFHEAVTLDCDDDCAHCSLALDPRKGQPDSNCRCAGNPTIACDTINGADTDDCGAINNQCRCYLGPPLPVSVSSAPTCEPVLIVSDYDGTVDIGTGQWQQHSPLAALIHIGDSVAKPCPTCEGDVIANDGVRDGTCNGGARSAQPCDVNGVHSTFGELSHDCQPVAGANISGSGLLLDFTFDTTRSSMDFTLPCDSPSTGLCPCRVCSGNSSIGCHDDAICAANGAGACSGTGGAGVHPNACNGEVCGEDGQCTDG